MALYIGLMSGTSLDGVDGVLARIESGACTPAAPAVLQHAHQPFPPALKAELLALNTRGDDELHRAALAANGVAVAYAEVVASLLARAGLPAAAITAVGAHGQTVRHRPGEFDATGYTLQLLNGALLAERSGVDVVCDLRSRDIAAGGQGAPLVPAFHAAVFSQPGVARAVLNLGGIANLTLLGADATVRGFDCGPANALLDSWCQRHTGQPFDADGTWSAGGRVLPTLLQALLAEPFLQREPPKSTGRDLFNDAWLERRLAMHAAAAEPRDVQATLAELTARSACDALRRHLPDARSLLVCGGGAFNGDLLRRMRAASPGVVVESTEAAGLPPTQVEAAAFAWLAHAFVERRPGNLPAVTGARGPRVLGALHPGAPL